MLFNGKCWLGACYCSMESDEPKLLSALIWPLIAVYSVRIHASGTCQV